MTEYVQPSVPRIHKLAAVVGVALMACAAVLFMLWFVVRVEVDADRVLVLVNKTGRTLPADLQPQLQDQVVLYPELLEAIAARDEEPLPADPAERREALARIGKRYKGIQLEPYKEGRYFPNPYHYKRIKADAIRIAKGELGVLIRQFGKPLPLPKTVATEADERGPVAKVLTPGRYHINPLAYEVQRFAAIKIPEGHRGVVTLLSGTDPLERNTYTVDPGEKGVQRSTLRPGDYYPNPYLKKIDIVDIRNRTYHMLGPDSIHFPSNDSFTITIEGTIEWSINPDKVASVTVAYGDEQDIIDKIILPYARSISRIEGSKLQAREFISGQTRIAFQQRLTEQLEQACGQRGIDIHAALVREIQPPAVIAGLISQREQADQEIDRSRNQIAEAEAEARLVEQQQMQTRNAALGEARQQTVTVTKEAELRKIVAVTQANRQLEVARLELEAATKEASALTARGAAEASVILFEYQAQAEPLKNAVLAFGDGMTYARHTYLQRVAPAIETILSNTEGPFAEIFNNFQRFEPSTGDPLAKGGAQ